MLSISHFSLHMCCEFMDESGLTDGVEGRRPFFVDYIVVWFDWLVLLTFSWLTSWLALLVLLLGAEIDKESSEICSDVRRGPTVRFISVQLPTWVFIFCKYSDTEFPQNPHFAPFVFIFDAASTSSKFFHLNDWDLPIFFLNMQMRFVWFDSLGPEDIFESTLCWQDCLRHETFEKFPVVMDI